MKDFDSDLDDSDDEDFGRLDEDNLMDDFEERAATIAFLSAFHTSFWELQSAYRTDNVRIYDR
jgi:hypothetical protein